jgi:hypothetical protein
MRVGFSLRSSYEEGTPHCRFQPKPEAQGIGQINLSFKRISLHGFRIEPLLSYVDRHALIVELWVYH